MMRFFYYCFLLVSVLLVIIITVCLKYQNISTNNNTLKDKEHEHDKLIKNISSTEAALVVASSENLKIISRQEWKARPSAGPLDLLSFPVPFVIIHATASNTCSTPSSCSHYTQIFQTTHIKDRHWSDIGYNFLVGGDGLAYQGRGWIYVGAHTKGYNAKSIGIAFIGTFNNEKPTSMQINACKELIASGVERGYVSKDFKLFAARQLRPLGVTSKAMYEEVQTWDHWANSV